jgi:hypothetical protein
MSSGLADEIVTALLSSTTEAEEKQQCLQACSCVPVGYVLVLKESCDVSLYLRNCHDVIVNYYAGKWYLTNPLTGESQ